MEEMIPTYTYKVRSNTVRFRNEQAGREPAAPSWPKREDG